MLTERSKKWSINPVTSTHSTKEADINISILQTEKRNKNMSRFDHLMLLSDIVTTDKDSNSRFLTLDFINIF